MARFTTPHVGALVLLKLTRVQRKEFCSYTLTAPAQNDAKPLGCRYLRLCDMGFAKHIGHNGRCMTACGTSEYVAPEMFFDLLGKPTIRGYGIEVDWCV